MLNRRWSLVLAGLMCLSLFAGCDRMMVLKSQDHQDLVCATYKGVDGLLGPGDAFKRKDGPVLVATFVDVDSVTSTSTLGRMMGELAAARLTQRGYQVVNMKIRADSVVVNSDGEFVLSREADRLANDFQAKTVLVGTYTVTNAAPRVRSFTKELEYADPDVTGWPVRKFNLYEDYLYVSMKLVDLRDQTVLKAYDFRLPYDENTRSLVTPTLARDVNANRLGWQ